MTRKGFVCVETSVDTIMVMMPWSWRMLPRPSTPPPTSQQIRMFPESHLAGFPTLLLLQSEQLSATARDLMTVLAGNRQLSLDEDEAGAGEVAEAEVAAEWREIQVPC